MLAPSIHAGRRARLRERVSDPILLAGNANRSRNLPMSPLPFRQDSTFLFFTGCTVPGAALLMADGEEMLFVPPPAADDALWHGRSETILETAARLGFARVGAAADLEAHCAPFRGRLLALAVPDDRATSRAAAITGLDLRFGAANGPDALIDAVVSLRRRRTPDEVAEMEAAAVVTEAAHRAAMGATRPGAHEAQMAALFDAVLAASGCVPAYPSIVTVRGEVLHQFHYRNRLEAGQLLLLDGGAERPSGYGSDVTRTWPVSGWFDARQRAAYDAVLAAQAAGISMCRPGVRYRDVHLASCRVIARWLKDEGLLRGDPDGAVESGAHALFFPHGVGHLLGLDVHDLEAFGDRAAYAPGRSRSPQFGLGYLRLDLDLEPGFCVTVEPGFYVVPAILHDPNLTETFRDAVDLDRARGWIGFGGIRIEDDVLVTESEPRVLTEAIPKEPEAVEAAIGTGPLPDFLATSGAA